MSMLSAARHRSRRAGRLPPLVALDRFPAPSALQSSSRPHPRKAPTPAGGTAHGPVDSAIPRTVFSCHWVTLFRVVSHFAPKTRTVASRFDFVVQRYLPPS